MSDVQAVEVKTEVVSEVVATPEKVVEAPKTEKKPTAIQALQADIASEISATTVSAVRERVKAKLVEEKIAELTQVMLGGIQARDKARGELNKVKPDVVTYNSDGSKASESYSKTQVDALKKATDTLKRVEDAIEEALTKGVFEKLRNLSKPAQEKSEA